MSGLSEIGAKKLNALVPPAEELRVNEQLSIITPGEAGFLLLPVFTKGHLNTPGEF